MPPAFVLSISLHGSIEFAEAAFEIHTEACLMTFLGFHANRKPLVGTPYLPTSGGGWIANGLVIEDRSRVGSPPSFP